MCSKQELPQIMFLCKWLCVFCSLYSLSQKKALTKEYYSDIWYSNENTMVLSYIQGWTESAGKKQIQGWTEPAGIQHIQGWAKPVQTLDIKGWTEPAGIQEIQGWAEPVWTLDIRGWTESAGKQESQGWTGQTGKPAVQSWGEPVGIGKPGDLCSQIPPIIQKNVPVTIANSLWEGCGRGFSHSP